MGVVVVTGGTRGIGYAIARRFAESYPIVTCGRTPLHVARLRSLHPDWDVQEADLSQKENALAFGAYIREKYPSIAVLVNNAGAFLPGSLLQEEEASYEAMLSANLHSSYYVTRSLLPVFLTQKRGLIVFISSIAALQAYPNGSAYSIAKAGQLSLARNLREQLKSYNVGVTALLLGATLTDSWAGAPYPPERFILPEAVAELLWSIAHLPPPTVVEEVVVRPMLGDL
ncbi:MAG: oxidoreductase [Bacteroidia bacterium]|nr:MAG: oxidoreductase [Bacteroidia bacterium]